MRTNKGKRSRHISLETKNTIEEELDYEFQKIVKQATAVTLATALLVGGGAQAFAKEKDSRDYNESYGFSHITRSDMLKLPEQQKSEQFKVPQFDASTIKNIPSQKVTMSMAT